MPGHIQGCDGSQSRCAWRAGSGMGHLPSALAVPRRVKVTDDTMVRLATQVRHTTVVAVPADERILAFVLGDPER